MSKDKKSGGSGTPKSGTKSIQDFGKTIKNLSITDYTKPSPPPTKPSSSSDDSKEKK